MLYRSDDDLHRVVASPEVEKSSKVRVNDRLMKTMGIMLTDLAFEGKILSEICSFSLNNTHSERIIRHEDFTGVK